MQKNSVNPGGCLSFVPCRILLNVFLLSIPSDLVVVSLGTA